MLAAEAALNPVTEQHPGHQHGQGGAKLGEDDDFAVLARTITYAFGLGFQLLLIGLLLVTGLESYIFPFFIGYSLFILVFIALRRLINLNS